jgi:flavin-dependent dehydrogenase
MPDAVDQFDVAIIGGGPAGSTCGTLLKKYYPRLKVLILERERFPRDHVGESQLPLIGQVLHEMGCWDAVERAGFPIKIGATYRWGSTTNLWDFEFVPNGILHPEPRPAKYAGQRKSTAFQVDRAIYDKILLDHAEGGGCQVRQETAVRRVNREGDRVQSLVLDDGSEVTARYYVDASGHTGILRRAMGVDVQSPTSLQNIAVWDYWQNAEWAVSIGVGGTRVQVLSQGYGWIWFIPLGPERTSIGLIVPAEYYKQTGKRPGDLYREALQNDPIVSRLIQNASPEGKLTTTKDWSFLADRLAGENWFLAGESAGFADPILAAGMTLAHVGARDVAYCILAMERRDYEPEWLRSWYDEGHRQKIGQHIRFADFWYTANGCFTDLQAVTRDIARDAGFEMSVDEAWQWLGTGGFVDADVVGAGLGGYSLRAVKDISGNFLQSGARYEAAGKNVFELDMEGAEKAWGAKLENGRITRHRCYRRNGRIIPNTGLYGLLIKATNPRATGQEIWTRLAAVAAEARMSPGELQHFLNDAFDAIEAMITDGWIRAFYDPSLPTLQAPDALGESVVHLNRDQVTTA